jgi:hypothetical protein
LELQSLQREKSMKECGKGNYTHFFF